MPLALSLPVEDCRQFTISPILVKAIGEHEARVLCQLDYLIHKFKARIENGHRWIYRSCKVVAEKDFVGWSRSKVSRVIQKLIERGVVIVRTDFNKSQYDHTRWYAINCEAVKRLIQSYQAATGDRGTPKTRKSLSDYLGLTSQKELESRAISDCATCTIDNATCTVDGLKCNDYTRDNKKRSIKIPLPPQGVSSFTHSKQEGTEVLEDERNENPALTASKPKTRENGMNPRALGTNPRALAAQRKVAASTELAKGEGFIEGSTVCEDKTCSGDEGPAAGVDEGQPSSGVRKSLWEYCAPIFQKREEEKRRKAEEEAIRAERDKEETKAAREVLQQMKIRKQEIAKARAEGRIESIDFHQQSAKIEQVVSSEELEKIGHIELVASSKELEEAEDSGGDERVSKENMVANDQLAKNKGKTEEANDGEMTKERFFVEFLTSRDRELEKHGRANTQQRGNPHGRSESDGVKSVGDYVFALAHRFANNLPGK